MKKIETGIFSCLFILKAGVAIGAPVDVYRDQMETKFNRTTVVRVLLDSALPQVRLSALSKKMRARIGDSPVWKPAPAKVAIDVISRDGKETLLYNGDILTASKVTFRPHSEHMSELRYQAGIYRGDIVVHLANGKLFVVNELPIEEYLIGTLPGEMSPSWELNALKAQAVASRTYALYMVKHPKSSMYDIERTVRDQVYTGAQAETSKVLDAVRQTEGEILKRDTKLVKLFFHARCGGHTESPGVVWNMTSNASFKRVECPYCQKHPFKWQVNISRDEIRSALGLPVSTFRLVPQGKSTTGRIQSLRIAMGPTSREVTSDELRGLIGFARLKSAQFELEPTTDGGFLFKGVGNGHGVGMCQWGAQFLARQGKSHNDILAYYYPNFALTKDRAYITIQ